MAKENGKRTKNNTLQLFSASVALLTLLLRAGKVSWMQSGGGVASFLICFVNFVIRRKASDKGEKPWEMGRSFLAMSGNGSCQCKFWSRAHRLRPQWKEQRT